MKEGGYKNNDLATLYLKQIRTKLNEFIFTNRQQKEKCY